MEHKNYFSSWYFISKANEIRENGLVYSRLCGRDLILLRHGGKCEGLLAKEPSPRPVKIRKNPHVYSHKQLHQDRNWLSIPISEQDGLIFAYYDQYHREPTWQIQDLDTKGWSDPAFKHIDVDVSPKIVMQDLAVASHFTTVHGYSDVKQVQPFSATNTRIGVSFTAKRTLSFKPFYSVFADLEFTSFANGMGFQITEVNIIGLFSRHFVLPTPIEENRTRIYLGVSFHLPLVSKLPTTLNLLSLPLKYFSWIHFVRDIRRDHRGWQHPELFTTSSVDARDVSLFQNWAKQFEPVAAGSVAA
jgi:phenylpropionate dioxygenase-like ring-hydroxylating dioxygenase large terminal subunit